MKELPSNATYLIMSWEAIIPRIEEVLLNKNSSRRQVLEFAHFFLFFRDITPYSITQAYFDMMDRWILPGYSQ
jgi:hypothetical protein